MRESVGQQALKSEPANRNDLAPTGTQPTIDEPEQLESTGTVTVGPWNRLTRMSAPPPSEAQYSARLHEDGSFEARYGDEGLLGRGGMGEVRLYLDRRTEREVAVKRVYDGSRDDEHRARFLREARIQAQLDHPTVVPVYDMGVDESGLEYFTMKPAVGLTLAEIIQRLRLNEAEFCKRYSLPVRLGIFRQICQGVEYAHTRGILHRDLKPSNVIIGDLGQTYLLDWGIAKVGRSAPLDQTSAVRPTGGLGTPGYMAPEQLCDADSVDVRADVYALGAILFELLTLEPLHPDEDTAALIDATQDGTDERRISVRMPELDVPPEIEHVCVAATETDPEQRLASVSELLRPISAYLDGDRDLALRHAVAQTHADAAQKSLATLLDQGDPDDHLRAKALREAGHALALNPHCADAVQVLTRLLATPPQTLPREAAELLEQHEQFGAREASRAAGWVYLALIPLALWLILSVEIRNWLAVLSMVVPLLFATGVVMLRTRRHARPPAQRYAVYATVAAIAATSTLVGPFLIMPGLMAGYIAVATSYVQDAAERPLRWALMCLAGTLGPLALFAGGLLPVDMHVETGGRLIIQHHVSNASPTTVYATLAVALLVAVFGPMVAAYRTARVIRDLRTRLVLQMWHLRKLTST